MRNRIITVGITLILVIGFTMPSCEPKDSCHGVVFRNYFEVENIEVKSFTDYSENESIALNDSVTFEEIDVIHVDYIVNYIASNQPKRDWSFSLMPSALACSFIPGSSGSKTERLTKFSIITLNDFDDDHPANSNINELFDYEGYYWDTLDDSIPLTQFISEQTENLKEEDMFLKLKKAPEINKEFRLKVVMELSTGAIHEFETEPFFIIP